MIIPRAVDKWNTSTIKPLGISLHILKITCPNTDNDDNGQWKRGEYMREDVVSRDAPTAKTKSANEPLFVL